MNAAQLIDYLKNLPPETEIEVWEEYSHNYMTGTRRVKLDPEKHIDYYEKLRLLNLGSG